ncbi:MULTISPECIES: LacI family DNA-binding transcriptional regulator [Roseobacteraceae]|uniref:LacI family transcriptional regulator n=1 Tax=Celeribacter baekdonensis B30 TaxID=1208323 RepID=K2JIP6_9RHOB|nr:MULTISPECIES: LacI family DNA-binding transcriptional regulator [Roseobacteraceae]EKE70489.1 LacI family transcriptional regulator [Celeribacter baekdonensis B30]|tara:strand:+ start:18142 stop:19164 length:1023 start_codon:yes stop_codon:yes gene_type:complete
MSQMENQRSDETVTADDVAKLAGVSRWTVNRAFKKDASISRKSREKVMGAAQTLGYVPDLLASSLASDRSNLVCLLIDDFANPHKLVMLERLTRVLRKNGLDTLLVNTSDEEDTSAALLNASQRRVDAAVLIGIQFTDRSLATALGARRVRKLIVFARSSENPDTISICCDDRAAMNEITDYIVEKGYRKPLFLAGPQSTSAHLGRKETFLKRWQDAFGATPDFVSVARYDPQLAYDQVVGYFADHPALNNVDIIVCENDALAVGAVDAIRTKLGLRVPEDIAVIGFDDIPQADSANYKLTTYRQPLSAMAEGLVEVLKGTSENEHLRHFLGKLVVRESA